MLIIQGNDVRVVVTMAVALQRFSFEDGQKRYVLSEVMEQGENEQG